MKHDDLSGVDRPVSRRITAAAATMEQLAAFVATYEQRKTAPDVCDFAFGNPHELPLPGFVAALQRRAEPQNKDWFAYKTSEAEAREAAAEALSGRLGLPFSADDIALTTGAFGAIAVAFHLLTDPGDEVIYSVPAWFCYEPMLADSGLVPVKIPLVPENFDLDLDAIARAITPRTRMVIVTTPHNPTGRVYPPKMFERLSRILEDASAANGRRIYLLSDEPYHRLVFAGTEFHSPAEFYGHTVISYSFGKVLLTPGQRLGYLALCPRMPGREVLREHLWTAQIALGWAFPNAIMQYSLAELEAMSIDLDQLQTKRDHMVSALRDMGYELQSPEGTFYLLPRSPWPDDAAFAELLAQRDIFVLPGSLSEIPGYFRISLTANENMIERSLPGFAWAIAHARATAPA